MLFLYYREHTMTFFSTAGKFAFGAVIGFLASYYFVKEAVADPVSLSICLSNPSHYTSCSILAIIDGVLMSTATLGLGTLCAKQRDDQENEEFCYNIHNLGFS